MSPTDAALANGGQARSQRPTVPARVYAVETAHRGWFLAQYGAALAYLAVDLHQAEQPGEMPAWLSATAPMAVVALADRVDDVASVLAAVSEHDAALPVLLVAPGSFAAAIDAARDAYRLRGLHHFSGDPGMHAVIEFLFAAGRRSGAMHFLPA